MDFNLSKFIYLSFKRKLETAYTTSDTAIPHNNSHKDLKLIIKVGRNITKQFPLVHTRFWGSYVTLFLLLIPPLH